MWTSWVGQDDDAYGDAEDADFEMMFINFSWSTLLELILKPFDHYYKYNKKISSGMVLRPHQPNEWLAVFCDEINLPDIGKYRT